MKKLLLSLFVAALLPLASCSGDLPCESNDDCPSSMTCVAEVCEAASCSPACASGFTCLHGACSTAASALCSAANPSGWCPEGQACASGTCCKTGLTSCDGRCIDLQTDDADCGSCGTACGAGELCRDGGCVCREGLDDCGGTCVDLQADTANCGSCGETCPAGDACVSGRCECPESWTRCSGSCIDVQRDEAHCGACGTACATGMRCVEGACRCASDEHCATDEVCTEGACVDSDCSAGCEGVFQCVHGACVAAEQDLCGQAAPSGYCPPGQQCANGLCCPVDQLRCGDACVDPRSDRANCGGCGAACGAREVCIDGDCACAPGLQACGGECVDPVRDGRHCGGCDVTCGRAEACVGGECTCPASWLVCGESCVDPSANEAHCGACGRACAPGQRCNGGRCECAAGRTACDGTCVDTATDPSNCGTCGTACAEGLACIDGACGCPEGRTRCGDACVALGSDPVHCGACDSACAATLACVDGACGCPQGLTRCGDACVDANRDARHCGGCGLACAALEACVDGECSTVLPPGTLGGTLNPARPASATPPLHRVSTQAPPALLAALGRGIARQPRAAHVPGALAVRFARELRSPTDVLEALRGSRLPLRYRTSVAPRWHSVVLVDGRGLPADDRAVEAAMKAIRALPSVQVVERVGVSRPLAQPNDPLYRFQWHYPMAGLPEAWDETTGHVSVVVAVLDDGITAHPDFGNRVIAGYDMVTDATNGGDGDGRDDDPTRPAVFPDGRVSFHGTHVAGTIGAATGNAAGVAGVDWAARLLPVRVLGLGGGSNDDIAAGIRWAVGLPVPGTSANPHPAKVLNLSLGGPGYSQVMQDAIDDANGAGAIVVVAAGNENTYASTGSPAGANGVITVGAVGMDGRRATYSNFGVSVDVMAPGGDFEDLDGDGAQDCVVSLFADGLGRPTYDRSCGTSMASPHVAGIVALMASVDPTLDRPRAEAILRSTAWSQFQCPEGCGAGLVDAWAAVRAAAGVGQVLAPRLVVSPAALELGAATSASLMLANAGGAALGFAAYARGSYAARVGLSVDSGVIDAGRQQPITVSLDRTGLADGIYDVTLVVLSTAGDAEVPLRFRVGPRPAPVLQVLALRWDGTEAVVAGSAVANEAGNWSWHVDLPPGQYLLVAGSDEDNDGTVGEEGEHFGAWPVESDPRLVQLFSQQGIGGLDFATARRALPPTPGPGDFADACIGNGDCASLLCLIGDSGSTCTSACGEGLPCPVGFFCGGVYDTGSGAGSDACLPQAGEGDACDSNESCDTAFCLLADPPECRRACAGNAQCALGEGCRGVLDANGQAQPVCVELAQVGDACAQDSDCGNDALSICGTWPGGYCLADCWSTACPGDATCVGFDYDADGAADDAFCLETCASTSQCRDGYICQAVSATEAVCAPQE